MAHCNSSEGAIILNRLSASTLSLAPNPIEHPSYDRSHVKIGIVHLGLGGFHRAHQAVYTDACLERGDLNWGILGVSLRSPQIRDALAPQDGLYTVAARSGEGTDYRIIGSVVGLMVAPENPPALVEVMAHPDVKIVSLTITEKGYCIDPATGKLDEAHPDILHDLAHLDQPISAPGFIVSALKQRRKKGLKPFTVMSCDNLTANGEKLRALIIALAQRIDPVLADFISAQVAFPSTMVDRIVPHTVDEDRTTLLHTLGLNDAWPIITERFSQWVIEDHFPSGRPKWEEVGAELVVDVTPYETMKLRLLNGSHSMLALLGGHAGHLTVADAMADHALAAFIEAFMVEDVSPILSVPTGADLPAYRKALLDRFRNPGLKHRLVQIASDSSQKIPQRFLTTARDRLSHTLPLGRLAFGIAAFIHYASGFDRQGHPIELSDPMAVELKERLVQAGPDAERAVGAILSVEKIFGTDLPANPHFRDPVIAAYRALAKSKLTL